MDYILQFTVFTPTYNRALTLPRVYESLMIQTFRDFEWLIVDDGSSDGTKELVEKWQAEAWFPIRYFYQENGGKHRAFNHGVSEAKGELFLTLDSDDTCTSTALEIFNYHWDKLEQQKKVQYSAISTICIRKNGEIVGNKFPINGIDSNTLEIRNKYGASGEKWGFQRTDTLKEYPFPEFDGEKFIPDALVWNRISQKYKTRYINEPLRTYEALEDGLCSSLTILRAKSPKGSSLYYKEYINYDISKVNKIKGAINYVRFSLHANFKIRRIITDSNSILLATLCLLPGYYFYRSDKRAL